MWEAEAWMKATGSDVDGGKDRARLGEETGGPRKGGREGAARVAGSRESGFPRTSLVRGAQGRAAGGPLGTTTGLQEGGWVLTHHWSTGGGGGVAERELTL